MSTNGQKADMPAAPAAFTTEVDFAAVEAHLSERTLDTLPPWRFRSADPNWSNVPSKAHPVVFARYEEQRCKAAEGMKSLLDGYKRFAEENGMEVAQVQDDLTFIPLRNGNVVRTTETGCAPSDDVYVVDAPKTPRDVRMTAKAAALEAAYGSAGFTQKEIIL